MTLVTPPDVSAAWCTPQFDDGSAESRTYDVFVDATRGTVDGAALRDCVEQYARAIRSGTRIGHVLLAVPEGLQTAIEVPEPVEIRAHKPSIVLERAMLRAAAQRRHLAVVLGAMAPEHATIAQLLQAFDEDPLFGTAQPRFADARTGRIWQLPGLPSGEEPGVAVARSVMSLMPTRSITPELLSACLVLRWHLLVSAGPLQHDDADCATALLTVLCQARRRGMRNVVVNSVVVSTKLPYRAVYPVVGDATRARLQATYPDHALAVAELAALTQSRLEPLLDAAQRPVTERRILVDCLDIPPRHNGSTQCALGFLEGFAALESADRIDVVIRRDAAEFHDLQRFPRLRQLHSMPSTAYFAAVTLTQPWSLERLVDIHRRALINVFGMLDTIAWDILYPQGANELGSVWRFVARYADGLIYNSHYTRDRFRTRFPLDNGVAEQVVHHSLAASEHVHPAGCSEPVSDYILVFGNDLDHKDLRATLNALVDAFPFNRFVAFGMTHTLAPNVVAIPSGQLDHAGLHRLIAGAQALVYPSLYEGFGLPVVEGLAYGRPVIARRSVLWREIVGWSRLSGELSEFDDPASLVENVGQLLAGLPRKVLPSGTYLRDGASGPGWRDCTARVLHLIDYCSNVADGSRWCDRDQALSFAGLQP
jgi:glycosyltransferase involved in cell wall biosynthesis